MKMLLLLIVVLLFWFIGTFGFGQDDYSIIHDRVLVEDFNSSCTKSIKIYFYRYNRTIGTKVLNGTATFVGLPAAHIPITVQLYKFMSNEYRIFPLTFQFDMCKGYKSNVFGVQSVANYSNFKGCPAPSGDYYVRDYMIDQSKFPPHIPGGQYKLVININFTNYYVMTVLWYGSVKPKHRWEV